MEIIKVIDEDLTDSEYSPMNVVFTLIKSAKGYLLIKNRQSGFFELPAGPIRKSETFQECAIRRSKETSNQDIRELKWFAVSKIRFENRSANEYFAIFSADIESEAIFEPTEEYDDILWFKTGMEVTKMCTTCKRIIEYYETEIS